MPVILYNDRISPTWEMEISYWQSSDFLNELMKEYESDTTCESTRINIGDLNPKITHDDMVIPLTYLKILETIHYIRTTFHTLRDPKQTENAIIHLSYVTYLKKHKDHPIVQWLRPSTEDHEYILDLYNIYTLLKKGAYEIYRTQKHIHSSYNTKFINDCIDLYENPKYYKTYEYFVLIRYCTFHRDPRSQEWPITTYQSYNSFSKFIDECCHRYVRYANMKKLLLLAGENAVKWYWNTFQCDTKVDTDHTIITHTDQYHKLGEGSFSAIEAREFHHYLIQNDHSELANWFTKVQRL